MWSGLDRLLVGSQVRDFRAARPTSWKIDTSFSGVDVKGIYSSSHRMCLHASYLTVGEDGHHREICRYVDLDDDLHLFRHVGFSNVAKSKQCEVEISRIMDFKTRTDKAWRKVTIL